MNSRALIRTMILAGVFKADVDEVKRLGGDGKITPSARTDDQSEIALF